MVDLAAALLAPVLKQGISPAAGLLKKVGQDAYAKFVVKYTNAFSEHLRWSKERTSTIKNMIYRDSWEPIEECYVGCKFSHNKSEYSDTDLISFINSSKCVVISGPAGSGKTMFMKWSVQRMINTLSSHQIIPLFIEVKDIDHRDINKNFADYLYRQTTKKESELSLSEFLEGLSLGIFAVFIDAVDECPPNLRDALIRNIVYLSRNYPKVAMAVSTRPDERLELQREFATFHTVPLDQERAIQVVSKVKYNDDTKSRLISAMRDGLFKSHSSFLSNPLLVTIMLITYDRWADLPIKITNYYKLAFEALYQRHDASKSFKRERHSKLEIDEFEQIFSHFCLRTYINSIEQFSISDLSKIIRKSLKYYSAESGQTQQPISVDNFLNDCVESASLLQKDGLFVVFSHRSFQEYFTARFCCHHLGANDLEIFKAVLSRGTTENVLPMALELNRRLVEEQFVVPILLSVKDELTNALSEPQDIEGIFRIGIVSIEINTKKKKVETLTYAYDSLFAILNVLGNEYPNLAVSNLILAINKALIKSGDIELRGEDTAAKDLKNVETTNENQRAFQKKTRSPTKKITRRSNNAWINSPSLIKSLRPIQNIVEDEIQDLSNREERRRVARSSVLEPIASKQRGKLS